jgi:hypothetical protein
MLIDGAALFNLTFGADHPAVIFQVIGQSRDDVPTVGSQAGGHHPGSQFNSCWLAHIHLMGCDVRHKFAHSAEIFALTYRKDIRKRQR